LSTVRFGLRWRRRVGRYASARSEWQAVGRVLRVWPPILRVRKAVGKRWDVVWAWRFVLEVAES
jgi:hypothetical protein